MGPLGIFLHQAGRRSLERKQIPADPMIASIRRGLAERTHRKSSARRGEDFGGSDTVLDSPSQAFQPIPPNRTSTQIASRMPKGNRGGFSHRRFHPDGKAGGGGQRFHERKGYANGSARNVQVMCPRGVILRQGWAAPSTVACRSSGKRANVEGHPLFPLAAGGGPRAQGDAVPTQRHLYIN